MSQLLVSFGLRRHLGGQGESSLGQPMATFYPLLRAVAWVAVTVCDPRIAPPARDPLYAHPIWGSEKMVL
jgi:hypothetical protein